jgi:hypothetical protein
MNPSIVIHGPQGCGKTMNAQRLRRHFGLLAVVEMDDHPWQRRQIANFGALLLTNDEAAARRLTGLRVLTFREAMRLAGFDRSPSSDTKDADGGDTPASAARAQDNALDEV